MYDKLLLEMLRLKAQSSKLIRVIIRLRIIRVERLVIKIIKVKKNCYIFYVTTRAVRVSGSV